MVAAGLALAPVMAFGQAAGKASDQATAALKQQYPKGSFNMNNSRPINGVTVQDFVVSTDGAYTFAQVTDKGQLVLAGQPIQLSQAPTPVQNTLNVLKGASNFDQYTGHYYNVFVGDQNQRYQLMFDAVGQLLDIRSPQAMSREMTSTAGQAVPNDVQQKLTAAIGQRFQGAKVGSITPWPEAQGFYAVTFSTSDNRTGYFVVDDKLNSVIERVRVNEGELPEAVRTSVRNLLNTSIQDASQGIEKYWQVRQKSGEQTVVVRIRPNGEVSQVRREGANGSEAITASEKQPASKKK